MQYYMNCYWQYNQIDKITRTHFKISTPIVFCLRDFTNSHSIIMANFGTTQRIPTSTTPSLSTDAHDEPKGYHQKPYNDLKFYCPCNVPLTSEGAAIRIVRNFANLGLFYTLFVWIILFITLIPQRKVSLILLVIMSYVTTLYLLLLRTFPNSFLLHKIMDKRFVLPLLAIATAAQLIATEAGIHLAVTLACSVPIVLVHAVLWISEDHIYHEIVQASAAEMLAPLSERNESGTEGPEVV